MCKINEFYHISNIEKISKEHNVTVYCVCGKSDYPVYIGQTEEEAREFIETHKQYNSSLHIVVVN
jgi:hypothetical protein